MTPPSPTEVVIEICGEGRTDVAQKDVSPVLPDSGVVPVLVWKLCDEPATLRVKKTPYMFLQGKNRRWQKVWFFKQNAKINGAAGCVFVLDSEGDQPGVHAELARGRDHKHPDFPMAIGVANPCIEAWLLSDASAIRRGLGLNQRPSIPAQPETLPAPQHDVRNNPKVALTSCNTNNRTPNSAEKTAIAKHLTLSTAEAVCPSFAAFADEVRQHIRPLFHSPPPAGLAPADPGNDAPDESPAATD